MREKRSFAERTKVLASDEVKKKYFLVYEGKDTEAIYFEAVESLKENIAINPLIEFVPVIRSYSEDGWSNPKKILDRMIKNIEELKTGKISYETLLNWIMDYFQENGVCTNNRPLAKSYWTRLQQICTEKLKVSPEQYDYVLEQCNIRKYGFYITNPCFEFWLLMHFDDVNRLKDNIGSNVGTLISEM